MRWLVKVRGGMVVAETFLKLDAEHAEAFAAAITRAAAKVRAGVLNWKGERSNVQG